MTSQPVFADRHLGPRQDDVAKMLRVVGFESLDDLMASAVPASIATGAEAYVEPARGSSMRMQSHQMGRNARRSLTHQIAPTIASTRMSGNIPSPVVSTA